MPPIDVYRIGSLHFVKDGHHRVSVARAQGQRTIDAYVTEIQTAIDPGREIRVSDDRKPRRRHRLAPEPRHQPIIPPATRRRRRPSGGRSAT